jgi:hypothetical protein
MVELPINFIEYFALLDKALDELCKHQEGKIPKLPSWVFTSRDFRVGITEDGCGLIVRIIPKGIPGEDTISVSKISKFSDLQSFANPFELTFPNSKPNLLNEMPFFSIWDWAAYGDENPLSPPIIEVPDFIGYGSVESATKKFSISSAKEWAIDLWNIASRGNQGGGSFIQEARQVFSSFGKIINQKSFLERRVHRYINEHAFILLPQFQNCYFEHPLYLGKKKQVADFILEREFGFPALLIELESPSHQVFRKNGELTQIANHAREQIGRWVKYIDQSAQTNAIGSFAFLSGPKDRIVIIGLGLNHKEHMLNTKFQDTIVWSYDLLLEQARMRWQRDITAQRKILGLEEIKLF